MTDSIHLRSVRTQVQYLCQGLRALEDRSTLALERADKLLAESDWKATYPWLAVILSPAAYRILTTSTAVEVWERLSGGFPARIEMASLSHGYTQYVPSQFKREERTREAIKRLYKSQEGPLLVVPVRIEMLHPTLVPNRTLAEDEFDFSLAATLSVLASHTKVWIPEQREMMFAALGEQFGSSRHFAAVEAGKAEPSYPVAGIRSHNRLISTRHASELRHHYAITGLVR